MQITVRCMSPESLSPQMNISHAVQGAYREELCGTLLLQYVVFLAFAAHAQLCQTSGERRKRPTSSAGCGQSRANEVTS